MSFFNPFFFLLVDSFLSLVLASFESLESLESFAVSAGFLLGSDAFGSAVPGAGLAPVLAGAFGSADEEDEGSPVAAGEGVAAGVAAAGGLELLSDPAGTLSTATPLLPVPKLPPLTLIPFPAPGLITSPPFSLGGVRFGCPECAAMETSGMERSALSGALIRLLCARGTCCSFCILATAVASGFGTG